MTSRPPRLTLEQSEAIERRDCGTCGQPASVTPSGRHGCVAWHDGQRWQFKSECVGCWNASVERDRAERAEVRRNAPKCEACGRGQRSYVMMPGTPHATELCRGCKGRVDARIRRPMLYGAPTATRDQLLTAARQR